mmetsp:Transcript_7923/g.21920  ORF Transcript_7923/g.21920 Transcript_7923/m.21920 type:complete len:275 (+) Transcript_7923:1447-2271(+)
MAPWSAQPRATHSEALRVLEQGCLKKASSCEEMKGMRAALPTSSTDLMSSGIMPASDMAFLTGSIMRSRRSEDSSSIFSRVIFDATSVSSMMHSMLIGASGLAEITFFIFSTAVRSLCCARALVLMSIFLEALNSSQKWSIIVWSKDEPPRLRSYPVARTLSCDFVNLTTQTCMAEAPTSTNTTLWGSSPNSAVLKIPYASAVAVVSCIRRMTLSPAIEAASSIALRWASVKKTGTEMTLSVTLAPWSASAIVLRSLRIMATSRSGVNVFCSLR